MGKKSKVGKARRDKFYQLAKETGFRARSAFKLLQLNRKYEFLQSSKVCVDLCAAPGGWLQVAAQNMPVSSLIIGIDLMPIKAIRNVSTFQEDITTAKCRQILKKELQTWKADVFLNDGAPNVGQNWIQDAFAQAELTLYALKLATEFLRKGGWFVTKVFRSKDYHSLMWIFSQLFKKVFATKPQASRNESAEIFVVCQGFLAPDKLDPKFTDPKYVFKEVETAGKSNLDIFNQGKSKKPKAEGYADDDYTLHHKLKVTHFIEAENHLELLSDTHELVLDSNEIANHPLTTPEIKECLKDIKVLGKKDVKGLLTWRRKLKAEIKKKNEKSTEEEEPMVEEIEESDDDEEKLKKKIAEMEEDEKKDLKKKRKKVMKEKRQLRDKMALNMIIPGDTLEVTDDMELFNVKKMKKKHHLEEVTSKSQAADDNTDSDDESEDEEVVRNKVYYDRHATDNDYVDEIISEDDEANDEMDEEEDEEESESDQEDEENTDDKNNNPLIVNLEDNEVLAAKKTDLWFKKAAFNEISEDADEDLEISKMVKDYKNAGGLITDTKERGKKRKLVDNMETDQITSTELADSDLEESDDDESGSDSDSDYDVQATMASGKIKKSDTNSVSSKNGFEVVPVDHQTGKVVKLDAVEMALGEELIKSSKRRREVIENSYNRYTFNDDGLPDWFTQDESKHNRHQLPVTKEQIREHKEKLKAINARAPKKIIEAKARKKRKLMRKLEKARKKSETVTDNMETTEREKWSQIKQIYKKAGLLNKKQREVTYVVAKQGAGKRVSRPAGVKGQFKVVDPRMKKDMRKQKDTARRTRGKGAKGSKGKKGMGSKGNKR